MNVHVQVDQIISMQLILLIFAAHKIYRKAII